ncbi:hypothetical protein C4Y93_000055 [Klebsiella pneumoniae subsp. pneumoniae]|nr:hypothetical protein C4Y93_000055 [Klebsiella pneumoniae subsp. pneumoniae]
MKRHSVVWAGLNWGNGLWDWKSQPPLKSFTTRATGIVMAALCLIPLPGPLHHSMITTTGLTLAMMYLFAQTWVQAKALLWWGRYHHILLCALLFLHMKGKVFYCVLIPSGGRLCHMDPLVAENLLPEKVQP